MSGVPGNFIMVVPAAPEKALPTRKLGRNYPVNCKLYICKPRVCGTVTDLLQPALAAYILVCTVLSLEDRVRKRIKSAILEHEK